MTELRDPVFIIGGGPSAGKHKLERLYGKGTMIAVNDCFRYLPKSDIAFSGDGSWVNARRNELRLFKGRVVVALPKKFKDPAIPGIEIIERKAGVGVSRQRNRVFFSANSGFAALSFAIARKARQIALIGFDLDGAGWWHGGYDWVHKTGAELYPGWASGFDSIAPKVQKLGVDVVNANKMSAIRAFRFVSFAKIVDGRAWK